MIFLWQLAAIVTNSGTRPESCGLLFLHVIEPGFITTLNEFPAHQHRFEYQVSFAGAPVDRHVGLVTPEKGKAAERRPPLPRLTITLVNVRPAPCQVCGVRAPRPVADVSMDWMAITTVLCQRHAQESFSDAANHVLVEELFQGRSAKLVVDVTDKMT